MTTKQSYTFIINSEPKEILSEESKKNKLSLMTWVGLTLFISFYTDSTVESLLFIKFSSLTPIKIGDILFVFYLICCYQLLVYSLAFRKSHKAFRASMLEKHLSDENRKEINIETFTHINNFRVAKEYLFPTDAKLKELTELFENEVSTQKLTSNLIDRLNELEKVAKLKGRSMLQTSLLDQFFIQCQQLCTSDKSPEEKKSSNRFISNAISQIKTDIKIKKIQTLDESLIFMSQYYEDVGKALDSLKQYVSKLEHQSNHIKNCLEYGENSYKHNTDIIISFLKKSSVVKSSTLFLQWEEKILYIFIPFISFLILSIRYFFIAFP